jgi:hypothetical protein
MNQSPKEVSGLAGYDMEVQHLHEGQLPEIGLFVPVSVHGYEFSVL